MLGLNARGARQGLEHLQESGELKRKKKGTSLKVSI